MFFERATSGINRPGPYIVTVVATILAYSVLGPLPMTGVFLYKMGQDPSIGSDALDEFYQTMNFGLFGISTNFGFFLMICLFIITLLAFMLCIRHLHKIPFQRLITPYTKVNWGKVLWGFGVWLVIGLVFEGANYLADPSLYTFRFAGGSFVVLLLISLFLLPLQTSCEELIFRGYLMPGLGLLTRNKWMPLLITSVLFGLVHGMNPEVEKFGFWTMQFYYVSAGLFLGLITILDDSLELALGVHAATNIFGATLVSFEGSVLQTDTLFQVSSINPMSMTAGFYISSIVFILLAAKKYQWPGYSRLLETVGENHYTDTSDTIDHLVP